MRARANIQPSPAGFVTRLLAFVLDVVVIVWTTQATAWLVRTNDAILRRFARIDYSELVLAGLPVIAAAYYVGFWMLGGRTPGKWILGLRVVADDGQRIRLSRAALRLVGYVLSALPLYAGFLWVLVDRERRAWHDRLAGTRVIYDPR